MSDIEAFLRTSLLRSASASKRDTIFFGSVTKSLGARLTFPPLEQVHQFPIEGVAEHKGMVGRGYVDGDDEIGFAERSRQHSQSDLFRMEEREIREVQELRYMLCHLRVGDSQLCR